MFYDYIKLRLKYSILDTHYRYLKCLPQDSDSDSDSDM